MGQHTGNRVNLRSFERSFGHPRYEEADPLSASFGYVDIDPFRTARPRVGRRFPDVGRRDRTTGRDPSDDGGRLGSGFRVG